MSQKALEMLREASSLVFASDARKAAALNHISLPLAAAAAARLPRHSLHKAHKVCNSEQRDEEFACVCSEEAEREEELRRHAAQLREQLAEQRRVQERLRLRQQVLIDMRSLDQMVRPLLCVLYS